MSVEIRKYRTDAKLIGEPYELQDKMSVWFRHYIDSSELTGVMVDEDDVKVIKGRVESIEESDDKLISVELVDAYVGTLVTGSPHLVETVGDRGERVIVQVMNLGEMGEDTMHPGMQAAYN